MKRYVVGFAFSRDLTQVLLVRKLYPSWQKNFWNGVGGKIEPGEAPHEAMVREFQEETKIVTKMTDWEWTVEMEVLDNGADVFYFRTVLPIWDLGLVSGKENDVGERLGLISVELSYSEEWLPNLRWLIPLQNQPMEFPIQVVEKKKGGFI